MLRRASLSSLRTSASCSVLRKCATAAAPAASTADTALRNEIRSHRELDREQRARFNALPGHQERARPRLQFRNVMLATVNDAGARAWTGATWFRE